jgi:hypothetical protein
MPTMMRNGQVSGRGRAWVAAARERRATGVLDIKRVELAIEQSIMTKRHTRATVHCPAGILQEQGLTFTCVARTYDHRRALTTIFTVFQRDSRGNVYYQSPQ